jgi:hypothetical protein
MSIVPDHDYYTEHGGKLSNEEFAALVRDAEYTVSFLTLGRSEDPPESMITRVKDCICAVVDAMHGYRQTDNLLPAGVASINNDGYSVTRNVDGIQSDNAEFRDYIAICKKYLTIPYNLMYMGVC